jgi:hypothetical protein
MTPSPALLILKRTFGRREHLCCRSCTRRGRDWNASGAHHRTGSIRGDRWGSLLLLAGILAVAASAVGVVIAVWG